MRRSDVVKYLEGVEFFLRCLMEDAEVHGVKADLQEALRHILDARRTLETRDFLRRNLPRRPVSSMG